MHRGGGAGLFRSGQTKSFHQCAFSNGHQNGRKVGLGNGGEQNVHSTVSHFKWPCHKIFFVIFFYETNPSGTLINRLKWFSWKIFFCEEICKICESAQANTARSQTIFICEYLWETKADVLIFRKKILAIQNCAESDSAQVNTVQSRTLRRLILRGVELCAG